MRCCLYCRRKIGWLHRLYDSKFCSYSHRRKYGVRSARALRDVEDVFGADDLDAAVAYSLPKPPERKNRGMAAFGLALLAFGLTMFAPGRLGNGPPAPPPSASSPDKGLPGSGFLSRLLQSAAPRIVHDDFRNWPDWTDVSAGGAELKSAGDYLRSRHLRLWAPSRTMADYDFEFLGQIDRKSLSWAFRATDARNFYAAKLTVPRAGSGTSDLVRFIMLNGHMVELSELPLPIAVTPHTDYRIRLVARGRRFVTYVNSQPVSSWQDEHFSRGGVGFFSDDGESAILKWASLSERDSLAGRALSMFSILLVPPEFAPAEW